MWLSEEVKRTPELLDKAAAEQLAAKAGCREWLTSNLKRFPQAHRPTPNELDEFANLFWSYFQISFSVATMQWGNTTLDVDIKVKSAKDVAKDADGSAVSLTAVKIGALQRLFRSRGIEVSERRLRSLANSEPLKAEVALWTYVWELRQRAKGKSKGSALHRLWRSLDVGVRKDITADTVMAAAASIEAAVDPSDIV